MYAFAVFLLHVIYSADIIVLELITTKKYIYLRNEINIVECHYTCFLS